MSKKKNKKLKSKNVLTVSKIVKKIKKTKTKNIFKELSTSFSVNTKNKKDAQTSTTDISPYFYATSNNKHIIDQDSVVKYFKNVKNYTITYPVMTPHRDVIKTYNTYKKNQKMKEKSRDINLNRNSNAYVQKTTVLTTTSKKPTVKGITTGNFNCMIWYIFYFLSLIYFA